MHTGKELIDYVSGNGFPDIVLLDMKMPVTDGFETLGKLRAKEAELGHDRVPVMFLAEDGDNEDLSRCAEMGVLGTVKKPFDTESLVKAVNGAVAGPAKPEAAQGEKKDACRADRYTEDDDGFGEADISSISTLLGERLIPNVALWLDKDSFAYVYRYIMRYIVRNQRTACKVLLILSAKEGVGEERYKALCDEFCGHIRESLRKSDIYMRSSSDRYFIFLTDEREIAGIPVIFLTADESARGLLSPLTPRQRDVASDPVTRRSDTL